MDHNEQFDELARRKLDERSLPFDEGHWLAAQQLMQAQRRGGSRHGRWALLALLLLLGSGTAWWVLRQPDGPHSIGSTPPVPSPLASTGPSDAGHPAPSEAEAHVTARNSTPGTSRTPVAGPTEKTATANHAAPSPTGERTRTNPVEGKASSIPHVHRLEQAPSRTAPQEPRSEDPSRGPVMYSPAGTGSGTRASDPEAGTAVDPPVADVVRPVLGDEKAQAGDVLADAPQAAVPAAPPSTAAVEQQEPTPGPTQAPQDGTAAAAGEDASPTVLDPVLPEAAARVSPWEIGVLAGPARSSSRYAGGSSAAWQNGLSPQRTMWYGVEAMRMGRHFGWGAGLHYGAYAERLQLPELSSTTQDITRFWYLAPVDTNILVVADTVVIGGQTYFAGQTVPTTIDVLTQGFDTTTTTSLRRAARDQVNRVHYFEVPLLLDAHVVQGRWNLGVRGGPTVGLLSGRRGSLPNSTNEGYTDLDDQPFRDVVLGWTARATIRYRFNAGWSLGVEPMLRGQFGNGLEGDALSRRSSAAGVMMSLSYRMR